MPGGWGRGWGDRSKKERLAEVEGRIGEMVR